VRSPMAAATSSPVRVPALFEGAPDPKLAVVAKGQQHRRCRGPSRRWSIGSVLCDDRVTSFAAVLGFK
jgi:hypothetical protein